MVQKKAGEKACFFQAAVGRQQWEAEVSHQLLFQALKLSPQIVFSPFVDILSSFSFKVMAYFWAGPANNCARWPYLKDARLKFNLSWCQAIISFLILVFFSFLTFSPLWQGTKKAILEHKTTCFSHSIIKEGQVQ